MCGWRSVAMAMAVLVLGCGDNLPGRPDAEVVPPEDAGPTPVERGRYIMNTLGACTFCHTPLHPRRHPRPPAAAGGRRLLRRLRFRRSPGADPNNQLGCISSRNLTNHPTGLMNATDAADQGRDQERQPDRWQEADPGDAVLGVPQHDRRRSRRARRVPAHRAGRRSPGAAEPAAVRCDQRRRAMLAPPDRSRRRSRCRCPGVDHEASAMRGRYLSSMAGLCIDCHTDDAVDKNGVPQLFPRPIDMTKPWQGGRFFPKADLGLIDPVVPGLHRHAQPDPARGWSAGLHQGADQDRDRRRQGQGWQRGVRRHPWQLDLAVRGARAAGSRRHRDVHLLAARRGQPGGAGRLRGAADPVTPCAWSSSSRWWWRARIRCPRSPMLPRTPAWCRPACRHGCRRPGCTPTWPPRPWRRRAARSRRATRCGRTPPASSDGSSSPRARRSIRATWIAGGCRSGPSCSRSSRKDGKRLETRLIWRVADTGDREARHAVRRVRLGRRRGRGVLRAGRRGRTCAAPTTMPRARRPAGSATSASPATRSGSRRSSSATCPSCPLSHPASTTFAAPSAALGYLHANCGHCHNPAGGAWSNSSMVLRLDVAANQVAAETAARADHRRGAAPALARARLHAPDRRRRSGCQRDRLPDDAARGRTSRCRRSRPRSPTRTGVALVRAVDRSPVTGSP